MSSRRRSIVEQVESELRHKVGRKIRDRRLNVGLSLSARSNEIMSPSEMPIIVCTADLCPLPVAMSSRRRSSVSTSVVGYRSVMSASSLVLPNKSSGIARSVSYNELRPTLGRLDNSGTSLPVVMAEKVTSKCLSLTDTSKETHTDCDDDGGTVEESVQRQRVTFDMIVSDSDVSNSHDIVNTDCHALDVLADSQLTSNAQKSDNQTTSPLQLNRRPDSKATNDDVSDVSSLSSMLSLARLLPKYTDTEKIFSDKCRHLDQASASPTSGDNILTSSATDNGNKSDEFGNEREMEVIDITLNKGLLGLGFCIDGGVNAPSGPTNITVKRLFKGNTAASGLLEPGDVIMSVNGQPFANLTHVDAWTFLKNLPCGPVRLTLGRHRITRSK